MPTSPILAAEKSNGPKRRTKAPADQATEIVWAYGLRTWLPDGRSHGDFKWDLTPGARTGAPDWKPRAECGNGLHANPYGVGDWSLMGDLSDVVSKQKVLGVVRYDPTLAIDLDGKVKAPWMEVVITTLTADIGTVLGFINPHRMSHIQGLTKVQKSAAATTGYRSAAATTGYRSAAATTGDSSAAATTGDSSAAATTGDSSAAATTGDSSAAATTGKYSIAAAVGPNSMASAGETSAIMLAAYGDYDGTGYPLLAVFAGMVGQTYGSVTIKPNVTYQLGKDGVPFEVTV